MNPQAATIVHLLGGPGLAPYIIVFASYVIGAIGYFELFDKSGVPHRWLAFVPGFFLFPFLWTIKKSGWNVLWLLIPVVNLVFAIVWAVRFLKAYGQSGHWLWFFLVPYAGGFIVLIKQLQMGLSHNVEYVLPHELPHVLTSNGVPSESIKKSQ